MIYVRRKYQTIWHIPKYGIAWADAYCGAESGYGMRGWDQDSLTPPKLLLLCPKCRRLYDEQLAFEASWPLPYTCEHCGQIEDDVRTSCTCGKRICWDCTVNADDCADSTAASSESAPDVSGDNSSRE